MFVLHKADREVVSLPHWEMGWMLHLREENAEPLKRERPLE
jgi:hypothetical protein